MWGQGLPFLVSNLRGLILLLALQYQTKWQWWAVKWGLLHFTHLAPWMRHIPAVCPYFQQFLHCRIPGFMLAQWTMVIKLSTLKCLLIIFLALDPFCVSQMSIQIIAILDLDEILMTWDLDMRMMLLNMWLFFKMFSISLDDIHMFDLLLM